MFTVEARMTYGAKIMQLWENTNIDVRCSSTYVLIVVHCVREQEGFCDVVKERQYDKITMSDSCAERDYIYMSGRRTREDD